MIVRAAPPTRNRTTPEANVTGDSYNANRPNKTGHMGMIAVRLNSIDMVVTLLSQLATRACDRDKEAGLFLDPASPR